MEEFKKDTAPEVEVQEQLKELLTKNKIAVAFKQLEPSVFKVELIIGNMKFKGRSLEIPSNGCLTYDIRYLEVDN